MKKVMYLLVALVALTACQDKKGNGKLDPNAKVYISPASAKGGEIMNQIQQEKGGVQTDITAMLADGEQQLPTAREVVEKANGLFSNDFTMGIGDWNRDLVNNRIIGSSTWAVAENGSLETGFISARDNLLVTLDNKNHPVDTIAYIPNAVMKQAEIDIRAAYATEDYTACYKLFEDAYIFIPTTGKIYKELQAKGEN